MFYVGSGVAAAAFMYAFEAFLKVALTGGVAGDGVYWGRGLRNYVVVGEGFVIVPEGFDVEKAKGLLKDNGFMVTPLFAVIVGVAFYYSVYAGDVATVLFVGASMMYNFGYGKTYDAMTVGGVLGVIVAYAAIYVFGAPRAFAGCLAVLVIGVPLFIGRYFVRVEL